MPDTKKSGSYQQAFQESQFIEPRGVADISLVFYILQ
jgi:hypothetical protein